MTSYYLFYLSWYLYNTVLLGGLQILKQLRFCVIYWRYFFNKVIYTKIFPIICHRRGFLSPAGWRHSLKVCESEVFQDHNILCIMIGSPPNRGMCWLHFVQAITATNKGVNYWLEVLRLPSIKRCAPNGRTFFTSCGLIKYFDFYELPTFLCWSPNKCFDFHCTNTLRSNKRDGIAQQLPFFCA